MVGSLQGQVIVNTRPAHQQAQLAALLESEGATVLSFPAIEIIDTEVTAFHQNLARNMASYHIALFVSRNAVDAAFRFIGDAALPEHLQLGVIGEGTHNALAKQVDDLGSRLIRGNTYNSEGLLDAPALLQVDARNILIFRGQQGRNLLGDELAERGARVSYCEVYRRQSPNYPSEAFKELLAGASPDLILLTSNEGMHNLFDLVTPSWRAQLLKIPWLLISERMRESALKLGHNAPIIIASSATDRGIQQTICDWADRR